MPRQIVKPVSPRIYHREGAPAAWWLMGSPRRDGAGGAGDVADLMGVTPAGTRSGPSWGTGPGGAALSFANSGGVVFADVPALRFTGDFTVECWFRPTSGDLSGNPTLVAKDYGSSVRGWCLDLISSGLRFYWFSGGGFDAISGPTLAAGTWYYAAAVKSGTVVRFHLDGVQVTSGGGHSATTDNSTGGVSVGYRPDFGFPFAGVISEVRVSPRGLSAADVARNFADPYWRLRPPTSVAFLFAGLPTVTPVYGAADFSAVATLSGEGTAAQRGAASAAAVATLAGATTVTQQGASTLACVSALTASATVSLYASASVSCVVTLAGAATVRQEGAVAFASVATLVGAGVTTPPATPAPFAISGVVSDYPGEPDPYNALVEDL